VTVTATIVDGKAKGTPYTLDFSIAISFPKYTLIPLTGGTVNTGVAWGASDMHALVGDKYSLPQTISAFSIGETEITYELWYSVYAWATDDARGANKYTFIYPGRQGGGGGVNGGPVGTNQHPVTTISWRDMVVWCNAYSEALGKTPVYRYNNAVLRESENESVLNGDGKAEKALILANADGFRLPNLAEWEYAARGGNPGDNDNWGGIYAGSRGTNLGDLAWYADNSSGSTHPVKQKDPNSLWLYDITGNVWELCWDISEQGSLYRGGGWDTDSSYCSFNRYYGSFGICPGSNNVGFRVISRP
jgi:formylglycine-generating enzyme required for sulfatase activity